MKLYRHGYQTGRNINPRDKRFYGYLVAKEALNKDKLQKYQIMGDSTIIRIIQDKEWKPRHWGDHFHNSFDYVQHLGYITEDELSILERFLGPDIIKLED